MEHLVFIIAVSICISGLVAEFTTPGFRDMKKEAEERDIKRCEELLVEIGKMPKTAERVESPEWVELIGIFARYGHTLPVAAGAR